MRFRVILTTSTLAAVVGLVGCGNAAQRSAERFCGELTAHANEIKTPPKSADEVPALITLYSKMGEVAPLDIEADWEKLYGNLKTANSVDVADPASKQRAADSAYATVRSATAVVTWAQQNCGLDLGPVGSVPGGAQVVESTTSTVAGG